MIIFAEVISSLFIKEDNAGAVVMISPAFLCLGADFAF